MSEELPQVLTPAESPEVESLPRADLPAIWDGYKSQAEKLATTAKTLVVTDASQLADMRLARATRLELRQVRLDVEARRKELVDEFLRKQQGINAAAKAIKDYIEPLEERLLEQEQFAIRAEERRLADLLEKRTAAVLEFLRNPAHFNLAELTEEEFAELLSSFARDKAAKEEADRKVAEELAARQKAEAEERERVRLENERLKAEAAEAARQRAEAEAERKRLEESAAEERRKAAAALEAEQAKARAEREKIEAAAKAEREAAEQRAREAAEVARQEREKAEAEARQQRDARERLEAAERKRLADEQAAKKAAEATARKAANAPAKEKLLAFAATVRGLQVPQLTGTDGAAIATEAAGMISRLAAWVESKASTL